VLALKESADVDGARAPLRRYLKDGQITLTPEAFGDAQAYTARAEFADRGACCLRGTACARLPALARPARAG